jgi:TatD DNase family protein
MAVFADSHSHLADPAFDEDREDAIARARITGARAILCIGESLDAAGRARAIAANHPDLIFHTAGVHPHDAASFDAARDIPRLREHLATGAVAIGECGLDYHYDHSPREAQHAAFGAQLELARELGKPVVVHTRQAVDDTMAMVTDAGRDGVRGVLHCCTGPAELIERALQVGWWISFAGVVTFRTWNDDALIRAVPADRLLVESDAPYLAPVPHRGTRNEPAWVSLTVARVAHARGDTPVAIGAQTLRNTAELFGLAIDPTPP